MRAPKSNLSSLASAQGQDRHSIDVLHRGFFDTPSSINLTTIVALARLRKQDVISESHFQSIIAKFSRFARRYANSFTHNPRSDGTFVEYFEDGTPAGTFQIWTNLDTDHRLKTAAEALAFLNAVQPAVELPENPWGLSMFEANDRGYTVTYFTINKGQYIVLNTLTKLITP